MLNYQNVEFTEKQILALLSEKKELDKYAKGKKSPSRNTIRLLKGYAGTGKTTVAYSILSYAEEFCGFLKFVIAAPTNRALKVISSRIQNQKLEYNRIESTSEDEVSYTTLHKLLYIYEVIAGAFTRVEVTRIEDAFIIIDEASLIDGDMVELLKKVCKGCYILFLGDDFQLPQIGKKSDVFEFSGNELTEVKRTDNGILNVCTEIRTKKYAMFRTNANVHCGNKEKAMELAISLFKRNLDFITIVATNKARNGFNKVLRERLGLTEVMYFNEKIVIVNNAMLAVNGDILNVEEILDYGSGNIMLLMEKGYEEVKIHLMLINNIPIIFVPELQYASLSNFKILDGLHFLELLDEFNCAHVFLEGTYNPNTEKWSVNNKRMGENVNIATYGYAMSCNKAQGSEFDNVIVYQDFCADSWNPAKWLYTAISRAKKNVFVIETKNAVREY